MSMRDGISFEYRIVTSGEDGNVFFWSAIAPYNGNDLRNIEISLQDQRNPMNLLVRVDPRTVPHIRALHQFHLTETGQIYAIVLGKQFATFVDNTGILTYYEVFHRTEEEQF